MIDAVIFDLFGTLINLTRNTHPYLKLCRATNSGRRLRESQTVDAPTLADFCNHLGEPFPANIADLQRDLDLDVELAALFDDSLPALGGLRERGIKIALISNLASPYRTAFHTLGLAQYFDHIVFSCDVGLAKPNPAIYRLALDALSVDASNAIMVGDKHRADVAGPMACGVRGYLVERDGESSGDSVLRSLTDVMSHLGS